MSGRNLDSLADFLKHTCGTALLTKVLNVEHYTFGAVDDCGQMIQLVWHEFEYNFRQLGLPFVIITLLFGY